MGKVLLGVAALSCLLAQPVLAQAKIVDQSNVYTPPAAGQPLNVSVSADRTTLGQSFTPTLAGINYATFDISNYFMTTTPNPGGQPPYTSGPNMPVTFSVSLYSGSGSYTAANLLGTSLPTIIAAGTVRSTVEFQFASLLTLIPTQTYSLIVNDLTFAANPSTYDDAAVYTSGNTYAGGRATVSDTADLYFSEGITSPTGAVPEPSSWAMLILGMGAVGGVLRRRRRASAAYPGARIKRVAAGGAALG